MPVTASGGTPVVTYGPPPASSLPTLVRDEERIQRFISIGHSLLSLLAGAAGGVVAALIGQR